MKLFATLFLSAVTTASLFAASIPRCDVSGVNKTGNVKLTPGSVEGGMKVIHQTWGDQATRQHRISATAPQGHRLRVDPLQIRLHPGNLRECEPLHRRPVGENRE